MSGKHGPCARPEIRHRSEKQGLGRTGMDGGVSDNRAINGVQARAGGPRRGGCR
ncbi:hypothetical protein Y88_2859 [Novosphingobium nitrogenifigens DSM 19370]|uniref:Uncharacterized protein n=1 Tax=Novosphingobium nitrogenifigens DSM 19370 TaxID=983920 RepID=F1Z4F9_9SPHN|nr:hypothetical protein Y88_2859 [Novosphingobium nitrogenifigens DSM 19370]